MAEVAAGLMEPEEYLKEWYGDGAGHETHSIEPAQGVAGLCYNVRAQYALGGLSNAVFASTYTLRLPDEEQLEDQVRRAIEANERLALGNGDGSRE